MATRDLKRIFFKAIFRHSAARPVIEQGQQCWEGGNIGNCEQDTLLLLGHGLSPLQQPHNRRNHHRHMNNPPNTELYIAHSVCSGSSLKLYFSTAIDTQLFLHSDPHAHLGLCLLLFSLCFWGGSGVFEEWEWCCPAEILSILHGFTFSGSRAWCNTLVL